MKHVRNLTRLSGWHVIWQVSQTELFLSACSVAPLTPSSGAPGSAAALLAHTLNDCSQEDRGTGDAVISSPRHCLPVFPGNGWDAEMLAGSLPLSTHVRDASPCGTPRNFAATEATNCFLVVPHLNCSYCILSSKALKIATSHKQNLFGNFFFRLSTHKPASLPDYTALCLLFAI